MRTAKKPDHGPSPIPMDQRKAYTIHEAARLLGVTEPHLRGFIRSGELQTFTLGRSRRITPAAIDAFIKMRYDCPGPFDELSREQYATYQTCWRAQDLDTPPDLRHSRAWKSAGGPVGVAGRAGQ
jgi:excisionase family DNA binding protein